MSANLNKLRRAIVANDVRAGEVLLKPGFLRKAADPNERARGGETPLMLAAKGGRVAMVGILLAAGADINAVAEDGATALIEAAREGHNDVVEALLVAGADVNAKTNDHRIDEATTSVTSGGQTYVLVRTPKTVPVEDTTALMTAVARSDEAMVRAILGHGPDLAVKNRFGYTALDKAIGKGDLGIVRQLIGCGAQADLSQAIYLMHFAPRDRSRLDLIRCLLDAGADVNAGRGKKPSALASALILRDIAAVEMLVDAGADINAVDDRGATLLFGLVHDGGPSDAPILEYLCEQGLDVNRVDASGAYPIIKNKEALCPLARVLIRAGATYVPADSHALFVAAIDADDGEIVEHLLRCGVETSWDTERQDEDQFGRYSVTDHVTMLAYAKSMKRFGIAKLLHEHRAAGPFRD